jgi:hypothetical protein
MLADSPRSRGVAIRVEVEGETERNPPSYFVLGHDSRLAQVMTNLIDNACSFSQPGGEVRVALRRAPPADEEGPAAERILVTVEDDGPGIPPHALERIFERFYTDRPVEGFGENSGLGLSISRQIVEAHGGRIWAENRPLAEGESRGPAEDEEEREAETRHGARNQILDEHVGLGDHVRHQPMVILALQIEAHRFLAAVEPNEIRALALHHVIVAASEIALRTFDLDDAGARVRQTARAIGRGDRLLKRHHQKSVQIFGHLPCVF